MEYDTRTLANITANGTRGPVDVQNISEGLGFTLTGAFGTASVQPQISLDPDAAVFVDDGPAIVAATARISLPPCAEVQFVTTGATGGEAIVVRMGGIRSDERHD